VLRWSLSEATVYPIPVSNSTLSGTFLPFSVSGPFQSPTFMFVKSMAVQFTVTVSMPSTIWLCVSFVITRNRCGSQVGSALGCTDMLKVAGLSSITGRG